METQMRKPTNALQVSGAVVRPLDQTSVFFPSPHLSGSRSGGDEDTHNLDSGLDLILGGLESALTTAG